MTDTLVPIMLSLIGVVVYPSGATYRYLGVVPLRKGQATYVWAGLPPSADLNSLRVSLSSGSRGYIVRRQIENAPMSWQAEPPDLAVLRRRVDSLEMHVARYRRRLQLVMMQENILSSNVDLGREKEGGVTPELVERYLQLVERRLPPLLEEKEKLQRILKAWEDSLKRWKEAYEARHAGLTQARRALHITCWSPVAENAALRVELFVPNAQWSLHYLLRVFPKEQKILLQRRALVSNQSGDDWIQVGLTLSTGAPYQSVEMPPFQPWYVDEVAPFRRIAKRFSYNEVEARELEKAEGDEVEKLAEESAPEALPEPSILNQTLTRLYELGTQTVLAGASSVQFLLREDTFPAQFRFFVNAPVEARAYLRAALEPSVLSLWENAPTTVEVEGQEVGSTDWKAQVEGDTVWVDLGPSQVIRVERRELLNRRERRLIGGEIVHRFAYELKLTHSYPTPIPITVWDRIPISRSSEIKVELEDIGEAKLDPVTGKLTWEVVLPPDKPWQKKFQFSLRYPKDKVVFGL